MAETGKNRYLLEIGTEELPVDFLLSAPGELVDSVKASLDAEGLAYGAMKTYVTPRRISLVIEDLPKIQADRDAKMKGPPVRVGLDDKGQPTQAGLGFARKAGVDFSKLQQETIEGETYLVLNQTIKGRATKELLPELLPDLVFRLSGSHFMAWGANTERFSRPIRWLVSLWNETHLPLSIGPVKSGTVSYGHRVLSGMDVPVAIPSVDAYLSTLEQEACVMADQDKRRQVIWEMLQASAGEVSGEVLENPGLLDTVTMLVEHPSVVTGRFEDRFLEIPEEVTTTVMMAHQKYFPVSKKGGKGDENKLLPYFMTISNGRREAAEIIRHGNEKVLTARLEDARFFFNEDQKIPLEGRLEKLKGITFQKGLGSLYEKTNRLVRLSAGVADALGYDAKLKKLTERAALLAKADLVTGMVFEFTELQGVMGKKYAAISGEPTEVSEAIFEHYLPRFTGDLVARSEVGIAVSLADKLDTMVAVFSQKNAKLPSGSKDPLGLRRMASGVIQTVLENKLSIDLLAQLEAAYDELYSNTQGSAPTLKAENFVDKATALEMVDGFILQRFRGLLLEQNIRYDIIDAVLDASNPPLRNLQDVLVRIEQMKKLTLDHDALLKVYEPANRIFKILGEHYDPSVTSQEVKADRFRDDSEKTLFEAMSAIVETGDLRSEQAYDAFVAMLVKVHGPVEVFFEKVLVNDKDEAVRKNRYNLLSLLNRSYLRLACFPKLVV